MKNSKAKLVVLASLTMWFWAVALAQETTNKIAVGKRDDITLTSVTKVGHLTLQPGHYLLQHRASGGHHAVHFVSFVPYGGQPDHGRTYYPTGSIGTSHAGEQQCKLEPLTAKAESTQVFFADEDGTKRITRIEIKGETVAHVF